MNYIYVDTKIIGAIEQLVYYFKSSVFCVDDCIVYYKDYKKETAKFSILLSAYNIKHYAFKRYSEIKMEDGSVVFYLFNAQSNCRIVSNRKCTHIFVTHGESNKASSIKPIIRIYDYICVAGELGIQRYLNNRIFYCDDVKRNKLIKMGNTFIGLNNFNYSAQSKHIVYAPTWEGGVPDENYSSLEWSNIFEKLNTYLQSIPAAKLIIQTHPNLGHRQKKYQKHLYLGVLFLLKNKIPVTLIRDKMGLRDKLLKLKYPSYFSIASREQHFFIREAFTDISAMETQFYDKDIPTRVFLKPKINWQDDKLMEHYKNIGISQMQNIDPEVNFYPDYKQYLLDYHNQELLHTPLNKRVEWLINFTRECHLHY